MLPRGTAGAEHVNVENGKPPEPGAHNPGSVEELNSAEETRLLLDAVHDYAIFALGPDGEVRSWNLGAARLFGYEAHEILGRNFSRFYGPDDLEADKPGQELVVASRTGRIEDEGWRVRKDGSRIWVDTIITALRDESGTLRGFAKVTRDLTSRRAAEELLRQSEEMFRLLVASVKEYAIYLLDPEGKIVTWNAGAERIKGYAPEEIIGRHFSVFYTEEERAAGEPEAKLAYARKHGSWEGEGWRVRKDGTRFWSSVVLTAVTDERGELRGFAKVTRDITDRKRNEDVQRSLIEQQLARARAEEERRVAEASFRSAEEANRAKDNFLATLSHELRTPMTTILGWSRLLPTLDPDDPIARQALDSIARSATLQAQLIDDVLDVSRIVAGKLRLQLAETDVASVLDAALESVRPAAAAKGLTVDVSIDPAVGTVHADPTRLQQVVWNLLTNAVKFTPHGGTVGLAARRTPRGLEIEVRDSGEGIEAEFLPHMFEPFRQAEGPSTRSHGGLGLGLSIVRYLVEAHGGTVSVASPGKGLGARFSVSLPLPEGAGWGHPGRSVQDEIANRPLRDRRLLVVDDDSEGRRLVATLLRRAGAIVHEVDSGFAALAALEEYTPDLIVTDLAMPVMDGLSFVHAARTRPALAALPIVALSAFPPGSGRSPGEFAAYLMKPVDPFELLDTLVRVLEKA